MKVLLLCGDASNQRALACRLNEVIPLIEIGVVRLPSTRGQRTVRRLIRGVAGYPFRRAWFRLLDHYQRSFPNFPGTTRVHSGVNEPSVIRQVEDLKPDLVLVSGTDMLRKPLIKAIQKTGRIINLHTGLSPYIKGGPNCTNWALAIGRPDLIGNTVMWLDAGIDSGNIISTERTPLTGRESILELHKKVMDHAHDLYLRATARIVSQLDVPSVDQALLGEGRLFLSKDWTAKTAVAAVYGFYVLFRPKALEGGGERVISLVEKESISRDQ